MRYQGTARLDKRTKNLVKRLGAGDVAVIDHADMDRVSAEMLLETGVEVVVNASRSISGLYPNVGPLLLARGGVRVIDDAGTEVFERVREGDALEIDGGDIILGGQVVASGTRLTVEAVEAALEQAKSGIGEQLDKFARNTLAYLDEERDLLLEGVGLPPVTTQMNGRHVLVVVRGYDYKPDLDALRPYIREMRPVLVGVDGGADAIIEAGFKPDLIVGDMDSVTDEALRSGAELLVHAYDDGRCPGMERLLALGLHGTPWPLKATSEDLGLLLPYELGADLIVAVGTHANLVEYLDKGRKGMASSFLVRLKVGPRLVDAKGVNKLYRSSVRPFDLVVLVGAALVTVSVAVMISPQTRTLVGLIVLWLRVRLGIG